MTKHLLDLRKKGIEKVKVIEKIIFKPRSFKYEIFRMLSVIAIVLAIGFGISNADDLPIINQFVQEKKEVQIKNFSAIGLVSEISNNSLTINPAKGPKYNEQDSYTFNISNNTKILTNTSDELSQNDLEVGDKIIVQGIDKDGEISVNRIISFAPRFEDTEGNIRFMEPNIDLGEIATTTATTTLDTSSTTTEVASSTDSTSTSDETSSSTEETGTSTPTIIEQAVDVVEKAVDSVIETVVNVIENLTNAVNGNTTETLNEEVMSESTPAPESPAPQADAPADTPPADSLSTQ